MSWVVVMFGGALGVGARMALSGCLARWCGESFPWGTLAVNASGCLAIGIFAGLSGPDGPFLVSPLVRQGVMVGLLGGYTTYSSFSLQTLALLEAGQFLAAAANVIVTLILCLGSTWMGLAIAGVWVTR